MRILFLKAIIPGAARHDLFAAPVQVHGYVTKQGAYVAPHASSRRKKLTPAEPAARPAPQPDLFRTPPPAAPEQAKLRRLGASMHEAAQKHGQHEHAEKIRAMLDGEGEIRADHLAEIGHRIHHAFVAKVSRDAKAAQVAAKEKPQEPDGETLPLFAAKPAPKRTDAPPVKDTEPERPPETPTPRTWHDPETWGVPAGTKPAERRRLNAAAVAILDTKSDDAITASDAQALARYTGRGGCGDSLNEFYTEAAVATAMWKVLRAAGFRGGTVLEPSAGTGVFLHTAATDTRVTAVELDPTSARIAHILHAPRGHEVQNASLERFATQDGRLFDAVIGNVPFGLRGGLIKDDKPDLPTAEDYFVDTALDKTRDGGLVALIVPIGIMDSKNGRSFRQRLLTKGEFLGAHRLPNTAFAASHTDVTSDILIFRKRPQEVAGALGTLDQDQLRQIGVWDKEFLSGGYFTGRGASQVYGQVGTAMRAFGEIYAVTGDMAGVPEAIGAWKPHEEPGATPLLPDILASLDDDPAARKRALSGAVTAPYGVAKPGDVKIVDGVRYILQGEPPRWHRAETETPASILRAHDLAELLEDLSEGRATSPALSRAQLIEDLDAWVRDHGTPARNKDLRAWLAAPTLPMEEGATVMGHRAMVSDARRRMARLLGAVNDDGSYSDLVTGATREKETASLDTVAAKLTLEQGAFTPDQLAAALNRTDAGPTLDQLFASDAFALDPDGRTWTTLDAYISGDLWPKLDAARAAAEHPGTSPAFRAKYRAQAAALEDAIAPQSLEDVEIMLNSGFVTPEVIEAFYEGRRAAYIAENPESKYAPGLASVEYKDGLYSVRSCHRPGEYTYDSDTNLLERYLNRAGVKKDERDQIDALNAEFREWLLGSSIREQVENTYNRTYRGFRPKAYSDAPIAIPGLNPALDVNGYHFAGLRWALEAGKGIIAADVGLGKTGRGLMLAKLAKATGQAKKPTFVVPKSVLANWMREAEFWFPGSRVLVIGETYATDKAGNVTSKPDDEHVRRRKLQEMQQNDYDFVFISQPAWNDIDLDPVTKKHYFDDEFWTKRAASSGKPLSDKRAEKIRTAFDQEVARRDFAKRENTAYFNELGVDLLILDEAHAYKNLYSARTRFGMNPKFLGGSGASNRALDTAMKTRAVRDANGGKGVYGLTATPTKNSPLEVWSMLQHIAPEAFEAMGIKNGEEFIDRFVEMKDDMVLGVNGEPEEALICAGFKNLGEVREVMKRFIDRTTAEQVGLKMPARQDEQHMIDMTAEQEATYQELRALAASATSDDTGDGHIFSIMAKMAKASLDLSLLGDEHAGARSPKIEAMAANAAALSQSGGQIVFCDHTGAHDAIKEALVKAGVPAKEIGIVNAKVASSGAARQKISDDFNSGKLKVVIGNTATMGEGINLQKRTTDIHHLDLPWEPASLQQRNGRGLRQGNTKGGVKIHTYLAKGSFDGYRWQTVSAKKDWQDLLWSGGDRVENLSREGAMSRDDMLIMLSANPEEARAKYETNKNEAQERAQAEAAGKAGQAFLRYNTMRESYAKLKAKNGDDSHAMSRLRIKMEQQKAALAANKAFPHKDLLDGPALDAVVQPASGQIFRPGQAFTISAGVQGMTKPEKWIVTEVDQAHKTVTMRPYGKHEGREAPFRLSRLDKGITPATFDPDAEAKAVEEDKERQQNAAEDAALAGNIANITDLRGLSDRALRRHHDALQAKLRDGLARYSISDHGGPIGLLSRGTGDTRLANAYDARKMLDTHDVMLPTDENRQRAIRGYVEAHRGRAIETHYSGGGASRRGYRMPEVRGVKPAYKGAYQDVAAHSRGENPWHAHLLHMHGPDALDEARAAARAETIAAIGKARSFHDAVSAAQQEIRPGRYDGKITKESWPRAVVAALREKADALGVTASQFGGEVKMRDYGSDAVHPVLATAKSYEHPRVQMGTVGEWLDRISRAAPSETQDAPGDDLDEAA